MSFIDRYTILRWKEAWGDFTRHFSDRLLGLLALCNASMTSRLISLGVVLAVMGLLWGLAAWLGPEPAVPMSKQLVLTATDAQGDVWTLDYLKNQNIEAILNGPVKPGQPLTLTVKFLRERQNLLIGPEITGAAGERYFPGILKNGQWQEAPKLAITDPNGKLLHRGQFEYG